MSYCRRGSDSDVYLIHTDGGFYLSAVHGCISETFKTHEEVLMRLLELRDQGLQVPKHALARLRKEIKHNKEMK